MEQQNLTNFIKYALNYVRLTRERTIAAQLKYSVELPKEYFGLQGLLNGDTDGNLGELINLPIFYAYDPQDVPKNEQEQYEKEKALANKIQDIYNKYRNDQFTKQIIFNFGYFEIELPIEEEDGIVIDGQEEDQTEAEKKLKTKIDRYPLFALPIRIDKEITKEGVGKYYVYFVDGEIQVNIGMFQSVLGEDLYFELLEEMGKYEMDGRLTLPITDLETFKEIWGQIKAQLRLSKASFKESSFKLEEIKIALGPKANYFLAEDLEKLSKLPEEELEKTSLTSWTEEEGLNESGDTPHENDLYFPFLYDKFQVSTLSIMSNKAAIIQGPPGTGKSETISNILCHLAATGKRVLFVSQKAQALKVVKDKLKKLEIKYLYGYLPNPNSAQIGEEDEADGIAPQLSGLGAFIQKLQDGRGQSRTASSLSDVIEQKNKTRTAINEIINAQRKYYGLSQELKKLKEYDVNISDFNCFAQSFSSVEWKEIKDAKTEIESLGKLIKQYEKSDGKNEFDQMFSDLNLKNKNFCEAINRIRDDVSKTGYDRHIELLRKLNNLYRNLRVIKERNKLPREIIEYIDKILSKNLSRDKATKALTALYNHCSYCENIQRLQYAETKLGQKLSSCGVSHSEFKVVDEIIDLSTVSELEDIKHKILRVQNIKEEMKKLSQASSTNRLSSTLKRAEQDRSERVTTYIQNIVNKSIIEKWSRGTTVRQIIERLARAFGKSKKAFKTFDNLRKDANYFNAVLDLIPIWIMELDDASRIIPFQTELFDYVILDEASQCNVAYTLPVMYRSSHTLFVGDSEQMRDSTIMFKSNRVFDELAHRYQIPEDRQIKASGTAVQSVLDIAKNRGFLHRTLQYHYRSPKELVGFSNKYFYKPNGKDLISLNSNYLTYKDTNRVIVIHKVESDGKEEIADNVNVVEAQEILKFFRELRTDERYQDKSIGILSFFNAQAAYIRELFEKEGFKEEEDNYKVSIIEGIQGDEKDIVIYSFVIRTPDQKRKYVPLTGEGGDINADINKGRVNVAFSRARLQVHCFTSMSSQDIPDRIWLKKYLEYAEENGEVNFNSTELKQFDSYFEEEFYNLLKTGLKRGYKIQNQVTSCGFKIDFVVSNINSCERLAIECDGPTHFKDEVDEAYGIYVESDEERQRVLEAAGWRFCRVKYSDWTNEDFDRNTVVSVITNLLK